MQEVSFDHFQELLTIEKEKVINEKLFKSSNGKVRTYTKRISKYKESYIVIGEYYLNKCFPNNEWGIDIDEKSTVYIMNRVAPLNIKTFDLRNISSLTKFFELVITGGKLILEERDLNRVLSEEEYKKLKKEADLLFQEYVKGK